MAWKSRQGLPRGTSEGSPVLEPEFYQPITWPGTFPARKQRALTWTEQAESQELEYVQRELAAESQGPGAKAWHRSCDERGARAGAGLPKPGKAP